MIFTFEEKYVPWQPDGLIIPATVGFEKMALDERMRLTIYLSDTRLHQRWDVTFDPTPTAFKLSNESHRLNSIQSVNRRSESAIFIVCNSNFVHWLNADSKDIYANDGLTHFSIVGEEWVDVICSSPPRVKMLS